MRGCAVRILRLSSSAALVAAALTASSMSGSMAVTAPRTYPAQAQLHPSRRRGRRRSSSGCTASVPVAPRMSAGPSAVDRTTTAVRSLIEHCGRLRVGSEVPSPAIAERRRAGGGVRGRRGRRVGGRLVRRRRVRNHRAGRALGRYAVVGRSIPPDLPERRSDGRGRDSPQRASWRSGYSTGPSGAIQRAVTLRVDGHISARLQRQAETGPLCPDAQQLLDAQQLSQAGRSARPCH